MNIDNKKINTFSYKNDFYEYGVPELKNNNTINMIKYFSKFLKNNEFNIEPKEENDVIKSSNRKFENEDDKEEDKSSSKEDKKKEIINLKVLNNTERENKFNFFHFNKMINNINNNNYKFNYHINNNNSININNNNIFNNINPLTYNSEFQFNYISSKYSMEDSFNFKSLRKINQLSNRSTRKNSNNIFKGSISFNAKTNSRIKISSTEYKKIMDICKRLKKSKKKKNIISIDESRSLESNYSKEIQNTLLNDYKSSVSKNKGNQLE